VKKLTAVQIKMKAWREIKALGDDATIAKLMITIGSLVGQKDHSSPNTQFAAVMSGLWATTQKFKKELQVANCPEESPLIFRAIYWHARLAGYIEGLADGRKERKT
jgi:hypothetical protein